MLLTQKIGKDYLKNLILENVDSSGKLETSSEVHLNAKNTNVALATSLSVLQMDNQIQEDHITDNASENSDLNDSMDGKPPVSVEIPSHADTEDSTAKIINNIADKVIEETEEHINNNKSNTGYTLFSELIMGKLFLSFNIHLTKITNYICCTYILIEKIIRTQK